MTLPFPFDANAARDLARRYRTNRDEAKRVLETMTVPEGAHYVGDGELERIAAEFTEICRERDMMFAPVIAYVRTIEVPR